MRKFTYVLMAGLSLAATFAQAETLRTRSRLISRTEIKNEDPAADVLRVTQSYGGNLAYEAQPTPAAGLPPMPAPIVIGAPAAPENFVVPVQTLSVAPAVYHNVKVRQARKAHPCAVPMQVVVADPCNPCCQVCVEVCVPPCAVADIRCKRSGTAVVYDFGKYEVEIKQRGDLLIVDYDR